MKRSDLSKNKFTKLTAIKFIGRVKNNYSVWECQCDCGQKVDVPAHRLTSGRTKSCGCWRREYNSKVSTDHQWAEILQKIDSKRKPGKCFYLIKCKICKEISQKPSTTLIDKKYKSCGCVNKREPGFASANDIFYGYKCGAKKRKLEFNITFEEFFLLSQKECYYCGQEPKSISKISTNGEFIYNGIDRMDNTKGYVKDNIKPCCGICNQMKMDMSLEIFLKKVIQISERLK